MADRLFSHDKNANINRILYYLNYHEQEHVRKIIDEYISRTLEPVMQQEICDELLSEGIIIKANNKHRLTDKGKVVLKHGYLKYMKGKINRYPPNSKINRRKNRWESINKKIPVITVILVLIGIIVQVILHFID